MAYLDICTFKFMTLCQSYVLSISNRVAIPFEINLPNVNPICLTIGLTEETLQNALDYTITGTNGVNNLHMPAIIYCINISEGGAGVCQLSCMLGKFFYKIINYN